MALILAVAGTNWLSSMQIAMRSTRVSQKRHWVQNTCCVESTTIDVLHEILLSLTDVTSMP